VDDVTFTPGPPYTSVGLRSLGDEPWLVADEHRAAELAEKRRLWAERPDEVFAALPGTEAAGAEVLDAVVTWLRANDLDGPGTPDPPEHPLGRAGLLVQEDLCVLVARDGTWHLDAASLHFPSHWRLADKLGHPLTHLHTPVAHYREEVAAKVETVHDRLRPGRPLLRRNWSLHENDHLFAPVPPQPNRLPAIDPGDWWLRSERQTLVALPASGAVLFTIRVQQARLEVLRQRPAQAAALAATVRAASPEQRAYKGITDATDPLLTWLDTASP
jgi:hypothetical protein